MFLFPSIEEKGKCHQDSFGLEEMGRDDGFYAHQIGHLIVRNMIVEQLLISLIA